MSDLSIIVTTNIIVVTTDTTDMVSVVTVSVVTIYYETSDYSIMSNRTHTATSLSVNIAFTFCIKQIKIKKCNPNLYFLWCQYVTE